MVDKHYVRDLQKYKRCMNKIQSLYKKACKERDCKGYRENLGYDLIHTLNDYVSRVYPDCHYREQCDFEQTFFDLMELV